MLKWLDRFPLGWLAVLAVWMLIAPITPEPHVVEKIRLLVKVSSRARSTFLTCSCIARLPFCC